jgi:hypothetical protein
VKYRTVIEIISEDIDAENALHTAGEYLRGNVESGVHMNCRTMSFNFHMFKNAAITGLVVLFLLMVFVYRVGPLEGETARDDMPEVILTP